MTEVQTHPVPAEWASNSLCDNARYMEMYAQSVADPEGFWGEHGKRIDWIKPYTQVKDVSYDREDLHTSMYMCVCVCVKVRLRSSRYLVNKFAVLILY